MKEKMSRDMKKFGIILTKEQRKHFETLLWLYDEGGNRRTGRTTLIAYALIVSVLKDKRTRRIVDHFNSRRADIDVLLPIIFETIKQNRLPLKIFYPTLELAYLKEKNGE